MQKWILLITLLAIFVTGCKAVPEISLPDLPALVGGETPAAEATPEQEIATPHPDADLVVDSGSQPADPPPGDNPPAGDGNARPAEHAPKFDGRPAGIGVELHWGFVDDLGPADPDPTLWLPMDGTITIDDGNPDTLEGIHLISALLFEDDGTYDEGRADDLLLPEVKFIVEGTGTYYDWIGWTSSTTSDWDGIGVRFGWEHGADPIITIETEQWSISAPASELETLAGRYDIGEAGQTLEAGRFGSLAYRVYDLTLAWGYSRELDATPHGEPAEVNWDGDISVSDGGLRLLRTMSFEFDESDAIPDYTDLASTLAWQSVTVDNPQVAEQGDGVVFNVIVPHEVERAAITLNLGDQTYEFQLPARFQNIHQREVLDDEGHLAHMHLHWCWYKQAGSPHDSPRIDLGARHEGEHD